MGAALGGINLPEGSVTVSAAELRRNFGVWQERAFASPIVVVRHGKPRLVLSSAAQFFAEASGANASQDAAILNAYAGIPEHSSEALVVLNRDLNVLAVNRILEDLAGRHASNIVGRPVIELFSDPARDLVMGHLKHVLYSGTPAQFDVPSVLVEGRHYGFSVFPHAHGVAALIVNRSGEAALRDELETYRSLAAGVALAVDLAHLRLNARGAVEDANSHFARITGLRDAASARPPFLDLVAVQNRPQAADALDVVLAGGAPQRLQIALLGAERSLAVDLTLSPIWRGPAIKGATAILQLLA